jgi:hypothetical protein
MAKLVSTYLRDNRNRDAKRLLLCVDSDQLISTLSREEYPILDHRIWQVRRRRRKARESEAVTITSSLFPARTRVDFSSRFRPYHLSSRHILYHLSLLRRTSTFTFIDIDHPSSSCHHHPNTVPISNHPCFQINQPCVHPISSRGV